MIKACTIKYPLAVFLAVNLLINVNAQNSLGFRGITIGSNIAAPAIRFFDKSRSAIEFSAYTGYKNWYFEFEGGKVTVNEDNAQYKYYASGNYFKTGFEYNIFKRNDKNENNQLYVGFRYARSNFSHQADNIQINDSIWGNVSTNFENRKITANWAELLFGIRTEIFKNVSMGWTLRTRILVSAAGMDDIKPYIIPGYGAGSLTKNLGFTYSIYYTLPFFNPRSKDKS